MLWSVRQIQMDHGCKVLSHGVIQQIIEIVNVQINIVDYYDFAM